MKPVLQCRTNPSHATRSTNRGERSGRSAKLARWRSAAALAVATLLATSAAHAFPTLELSWVDSSGAGVPGGQVIEAENGDLLTLEVLVVAGPEGVDAYQFSLDFDMDLENELDLLSFTTFEPLGNDLVLTPIFTESEIGIKGSVERIANGCLIIGCGVASTTFVAAEAVFRVVDVQDDGWDLLPYLNVSIGDGFLDNSNNYQASSFRVPASVVPTGAIPEPSAGLLAAIGLAGLGWRRLRSARR